MTFNNLLHLYHLTSFFKIITEIAIMSAKNILWSANCCLQCWKQLFALEPFARWQH